MRANNWDILSAGSLQLRTIVRILEGLLRSWSTHTTVCLFTETEEEVAHVEQIGQNWGSVTIWQIVLIFSALNPLGKLAVAVCHVIRTGPPTTQRPKENISIGVNHTRTWKGSTLKGLTYRFSPRQISYFLVGMKPLCNSCRSPSKTTLKDDEGPDIWGSGPSCSHGGKKKEEQRLKTEFDPS